jgi:DNA polymerase epsilon subunit 1
MAEAFRCLVVFPNKERSEFEKFYKGHLIENETYIGGHVEAIRTGVYRNDLKYSFKLKKETYQMLIDEVNDVFY